MNNQQEEQEQEIWNEYKTAQQEKKDASIEAQYDAFMDAINDGDTGKMLEITSNAWEYTPPTLEDEDEETEAESAPSITPEDTTPPTITPAPEPARRRRVFTEERQRFVSRKQEDYSYTLAMKIRQLLKQTFGEETSATQWHRNFSIEMKLQIISELEAGRNFNTK